MLLRQKVQTKNWLFGESSSNFISGIIAGAYLGLEIDRMPP